MTFQPLSTMATKTVDGVGTYTVAADGTATFAPENHSQVVRPAVTVGFGEDKNEPASVTYTPTVTQLLQQQHQLNLLNWLSGSN